MGCGNERTGTRRSCHSSVTFFCTYYAVPYDGIWWFIYTHASDAVMDSQLHGDLGIRELAYVAIDTHTQVHFCCQRLLRLAHTTETNIDINKNTTTDLINNIDTQKLRVSVS